MAIYDAASAAPTKDVQLIAEEPAEEDALSGGGHDRTAQELVRNVRAMRLRGGAIGLEGAWGSGKSTVIRIAAKRLTEGANPFRSLRVFGFDLWAYQTENFRSAFLRVLLTHVELTVPSLKGYANATKKRIRTKSSESESTSTKRYSLPAAYFLLLTPLLPLAFTWLAPAYLANATITQPTTLFGADIKDLITWAIAIGYLLIVAKFLHNLSISKVKGFWTRLAAALSSAVSVFSKDAETEKSRKVVIDEDPAANLFHETFHEILAKLSEKQCEFVFVFDNVDRLPAEVVPEIWADLRLVFSREIEAPIGGVAPIVIIPFDRHHILSVMGAANDPQADLLSKTFDRILRVSPPVLTDAQAYFAKCIEHGFRKTVDAPTGYRLYRLFDRMCDREGIIPTPRKIVAFVNELTSLWAQWSDEIPLVTAALYLAHREYVDGKPKVAEEIQKFDAASVSIAGDDDWFKNVAALTFNVRPGLAYHVLLQPRIARALPEGLDVDLEAIAKAEGFEIALVRTINDNANLWAGSDPWAFSRAAVNLSKLTVSSDCAADVWRALADAVSSLASVQLERDGFDGYVEILQHQHPSSRREVAKRICAWLTQSLNVGSGDPTAQGLIWKTSLDRVAGTLEGDARGNLLTQIRVPAQAKYCVGLALGASQSAIPYRSLPLPYSTNDEVSHLVAYIVENREDADIALSGFRSSSFDTRLDEIGAAITKRMLQTAQAPSKVAVGTILALPPIFARSKSRSTYVEQLATFVASGGLLAHCLPTSKVTRPLLPAAALFLTVEISESVLPSIPPTHPILGDLTKAIAWYQEQLDRPLSERDALELAGWIEAADTLPTWMRLALTAPRPSLDQVVKLVVMRRDFTMLTVADPIRYYPRLRTLLGPELLPAFLRHYQRWSGHFPSAVEEVGVVTIDPQFFEDVAATDAPRLAWFFDELGRQTGSYTSGEWLEVLHGDSAMLRRLLARKSADAGYPVTAPYRDALLAHARGLLDGSDSRSAIDLDWRDVVNVLQPNTRQKFVAGLYPLLSRTPASQANWDLFFKHYGRYITLLPLDRYPAGTIDNILIPLLRSPLAETSGVLTALSEQLPKVIAKASSSAKTRLAKAASVAAASTDKGICRKAALLRQATGRPKVKTLKKRKR